MTSPAPKRAKKPKEEVIGDWREINFAQNQYNKCMDCGAYRTKMFYRVVKSTYFVRSIIKCPECMKK